MCRHGTFTERASGTCCLVMMRCHSHQHPLLAQVPLLARVLDDGRVISRACAVCGNALGVEGGNDGEITRASGHGEHFPLLLGGVWNAGPLMQLHPGQGADAGHVQAHAAVLVHKREGVKGALHNRCQHWCHCSTEEPIGKQLHPASPRGRGEGNLALGQVAVML